MRGVLIDAPGAPGYTAGADPTAPPGAPTAEPGFDPDLPWRQARSVALLTVADLLPGLSGAPGLVAPVR